MSAAGRVLDILRRIFVKGVQSVQPASLFRGEDELARELSSISNNGVFSLFGEKVIATEKKFHVIGFGKAVLGMAVRLERILGTRLKSGILSVPLGTGRKFSTVEEMQLLPNSVIQVHEGAENNLPDKNAMQAAIKIKRLAESMTENDILFVLISGGGSALLPLPVPSINLEDKASLIRRLASKGATIEEVNTVRIAISQIKGGKLAICAKRAFKVISLVISDIVNDPLELIASGPTVPSSGNKRETTETILKKYNIWESLSRDLKTHIIEQNTIPPSVKNSSIHVIGNNKIAVSACHKEALQLGYYPFILSTSVTGNVVDIAAKYECFLRALQDFLQNNITEEAFVKHLPFQECPKDQFLQFLKSREQGKPICLILGGEPTVEVSGSGIGGRNQELALRMSLAFYENCTLRNMYFLSAGTDGIDGPTPAAGAIGCKNVFDHFLETRELTDGKEYLNRNDSYSFYKNLCDGYFHVITGHTGTNVMDLHLIIVPT